MPRGFVFHKRRRTKIRKLPRPKDKPIKTGVGEEPPIGLIQGKKPGSVQEWRVGYCLQYLLKVPFEFQKAVAGGRRLRGGQVVDFWVFTKPLPTPIYVQGDYWHKGIKAVEDDIKIQSLLRIYAGQINMPVLLWEHQLETLDETLAVLRRYVV